MIRFIHTADIHFGMENYGKIDPKTGIHSRLLDFERALNACIDCAIEQDVDFFLFAGDAYKTTNPSPTQQKLLFNCFLRLYQAGIPIVGVVGNHDNPLSFGKAHTLDVFNQLPVEGFHMMAKATSLRLNTKRGVVQIVGIPWPTRNSIALSHAYAGKAASEITDYIAQAVGSIVAQYARELDPTLPAVLTGHLTVSSGVFSGSEKRAIYGNDPVLLPSQLAIPPFDYVALGHLHRHQNLNLKGYPPLVYSGSIERVDFGERKEDKGFCLVSIPEKGKATYEFITTPMRPFIQVDVKLVSETDHTDQILAALARYDITDAVVKVVYHVPDGKRDRVDLQRIEAACARAIELVGIIPVREIASRPLRAAVKVDMDFELLLAEYFATKPECADHKQVLMRKALELYELAQQEQGDEEERE